ncbi:MAG: hypothetical protein ACKOPO_01125 [Novosphingobium sp.]
MRNTALLFALALPVAAHAAEDDGTCRNGLFAETEVSVSLAAVAGKGRAHFWYDMDDCPQAGERCRLRSYLVAGDRVLAGRSKGAWTCAFYPGKGGGSAGWIESARLSRLPANPKPPIEAWLGDWESDGARYVSFRRKGVGLSIRGTAFWPARDVDPRERPGGPNMGEIDGSDKPAGNRLFESGCSVRFVLLGDWLVGSDPSRECDGMNVTFSGVYKRAAKARR